MSRLVEKVNLPIYGKMYVACAEDATMDAMQELQEPLKKLYEYEQDEENGTLAHLPCKVGDKLFTLWEEKYKGYIIIEVEVKEVIFGGYGIEMKVERLKAPIYCFYISKAYIGEVVFFTHEEAEQRLKEMEKNIK